MIIRGKGGRQVIIAWSRGGWLGWTVVTRFHAAVSHFWIKAMNVLFGGTQREPRAGTEGTAVRVNKLEGCIILAAIRACSASFLANVERVGWMAWTTEFGLFLWASL